jgi:hypothetical protein
VLLLGGFVFGTGCTVHGTLVPEGVVLVPVVEPGLLAIHGLLPGLLPGVVLGFVVPGVAPGLVVGFVPLGVLSGVELEGAVCGVDPAGAVWGLAGVAVPGCGLAVPGAGVAVPFGLVVLGVVVVEVWPGVVALGEVVVPLCGEELMPGELVLPAWPVLLPALPALPAAAPLCAIISAATSKVGATEAVGPGVVVSVFPPQWSASLVTLLT